MKNAPTVPENVPYQLCPNREAHAEDKPLPWLQLAARATVFERDSLASVRHESLPRKWLCPVYLRVRGEVAERLKAAVC